jgi:hypothetical protein
MASGGMYDHIGGGFARYSVDERWLVPHFEKMLYDQALLVRVYTHAAAGLADRFDTSRWRQVVAETVGYVRREMTQAAGGFSSAPQSRGPVPHLDARRGAGGARTHRRPGRARVVRHHGRGQLRGALDPQSSRPAGPVGAPRRHRDGPPAPV